MLLIHGTFSNSQNLVNYFQGTEFGKKFLHDANRHYPGGILVFDHPTVALSPVLNAVDLAHALRGWQGEVDVVCHSRGGLVARWWLEGIGGPGVEKARVALAGSPLNGTSLAAPDRAKAVIRLLTEYGKAAATVGGMAAASVPFLNIAPGLLQLLNSVGGVMGSLPIADGVVSLMPGLAAMSQVTNNPELRRLQNRQPGDHLEYFAIQSNFEAEDPGWQFWKHFRAGNVLDATTDFLFDGPNDLVVDTVSMRRLSGGASEESLDIPARNVLDFGTNPTVHHLRYFLEARTVEFLRDRFQVPLG